jgi:hypothetical protein
MRADSFELIPAEFFALRSEYNKHTGDERLALICFAPGGAGLAVGAIGGRGAADWASG